MYLELSWTNPYYDFQRQCPLNYLDLLSFFSKAINQHSLFRVPPPASQTVPGNPSFSIFFPLSFPSFSSSLFHLPPHSSVTSSSSPSLSPTLFSLQVSLFPTSHMHVLPHLLFSQKGFLETRTTADLCLSLHHARLSL